MSCYLDFFCKNIEDIKKQGRYRDFRVVEKQQSAYPIAKNAKNGKDLTIWCSNDYLGMSVNADVIDAFVKTAQESGVGSGGTRNISGTSGEIATLEAKIAKFHGKESGLVFTSGYVSNLASLSAIVAIIPDIVIFSDEKNHASIISGIRHNKAKRHIFAHNDVKNLEDLISEYPKETPKLIVFEGVYSMDGSTPNIVKIVEIAKKYNAMTYIDEVHAVGLYGKTGGGIAQFYGIEDEIDIIEGTFAKAFGVIGGYITAKAEICDAIRLNGSSFIFTTSLPPAICAAISKSIDIASSSLGDELRKKHFTIVDFIKSNLVSMGIEFLQNESINTHIIPVIIGDAKKAEQISHILQDEYGIYVQNINYPTVPKGSERLRITASPLHTIEMARGLCDALGKAIKF
ncbi:5-aminolevulinate synthase [Candidatus Deianiraea vastatrix]|uniref:5-aminolevulinate synthase n=1 Tax=Candidatus Deianiraea vastatrix TaxID=2163644 RepID=A0A5B8XEE4_9RICK|nr:5-aminolevulinate synthase [Candidatus Deianiraea vastatrix]QED23255.1 5-aminolevulinate synthase [Candidatus Deianiraea vastatrix]